MSTDAPDNPFSNILPDAVRCCYSQHPPENAELLLAPYPNSETMSATRRLEFAHGRYCAELALWQLGIKSTPIHSGEQREPLWPEGITGSITHCGGYAAAAVAQTSNLASIGIDLETREPLADDIVSLICTTEELEWIKKTDQPDWMTKVIFSAKESIYKAAWPLLFKFMDFHDLNISLNISPNNSRHTYKACPTNSELPKNFIEQISGCYSTTDKYIHSAAWLLK